MTVTPIEGEALRFRVASDSGQDAYLCDMGCYGGIGRCDCADFLHRKEPLLAQAPNPAALPPGDRERHQCKHLRRCCQYLASRVVDAVRQQEQQRSQATGVTNPDPWT